jgi:hypothetical protein
MTTDQLPEDIRDKYEVREWKHACAVLTADFPEQWSDIVHVLRAFRFGRSDILARGGNISGISKWFNKNFVGRGWAEHAFQTKIVVDQREALSPTHAVDCVKGKVALEIEWSNKDPFFDRDLNNFRLLFDLRAISVRVIITKSDELSGILKGLGKTIWNKYGWTTTWMRKLTPRIEGGGGGGCPVLVFGITSRCYDERA